ncbi:MAG: nitroreductase [Halieaceae bacterium]
MLADAYYLWLFAGIMPCVLASVVKIMSEILKFLQSRNSSPKLIDPAPTADQLASMFKAALRAPDHAWLRPSRFITIEGDRRADFGEVLERCLVARNADAEKAACTRAMNAPLRAPLLVVSVVEISEHPKVPAVEQRLSAGCAAHALLLAAEAQGYAGIWRTGDAAFDRRVMDALGLAANEEIIGFLYIGTRAGKIKSLPDLSHDEFVSQW